MIITHIIADNVLKYDRLEISDIPREGVITICGQNESGKSTIGETVCFALFGRTFSIGEDDDLKRIIRWGESRCSVQLGLSVSGVDYELARFLDDEGNHGARLYHAGEPDRLVAKGLAAVSEALDELIGFQYSEFVESFYLAQREITTPHPHSHAVKTMAGISSLERVEETMLSEIEVEKSRLPDVEGQLATIDEDIDAIGLDPEKLGLLQGQHKDAKTVVETLSSRDEELKSALAEYEERVPAIRSAKIGGGIAKVIAVFGLLLALVAGISWYVLTQMPGSEIATGLESTLVANSPGWGEESPKYLGMAGIVSAVIALLAFLFVRSLGSKVAELRTCGDRLAKALGAASEEIPEGGKSDSKEEESSESPEDAKSADDEAEEVVELISVEEEKIRSIRRCKLAPAESSETVSEVRSQVAKKKEAQEGVVTSLDRAIAEETGRKSKADALGGVAADLKEKIGEAERKIELRKKACELIHGSARHISQRFNHDLRNLASGTLPLFTEGRYEHLHIDTDLNVRVFSSLKRDFMDLEEISSGTQRQIMLAVRLALSQELVNTTAGGNQFIFLDEPFAFFDPARTKNAMEILPKLSDDIAQIWVIAQEFPEDTECEMSIECARVYESLEANPDS